jgi:glycosyltransferase involved in cell wall biosynthesis
MHKKINLQKTILTIGIPTYNRQEKLKKCMDSVVNQQVDGNVEILISDNASKDATQEYVKKVISSKNSVISYVRNKTNEGFDNNILNIYKNAKGRYVWFLSDDDEMLPGALGRVIEALTNYEPTVLYPNEIAVTGEPMTKNGQFIDIVSYMPTGLGVKIKTDENFLVNSDVSRLAIVRLASFISCCIVVKQDNIISEVLKMSYDNTGLVQDAIMSLALLRKPVVYLMKEPSIRMGLRSSFSEWSMESTLFGFKKLYSNKALKYPSDLVRRVSLNNCKFGLLILSQKKILKIPVYWNLDLRKLVGLIKSYKKASFFLMPFVAIVLMSKIIPGFLFQAFFQSAYKFAKMFARCRSKFSQSEYLNI